MNNPKVDRIPKDGMKMRLTSWKHKVGKSIEQANTLKMLE